MDRSAPALLPYDGAGGQRGALANVRGDTIIRRQSRFPRITAALAALAVLAGVAVADAAPAVADDAIAPPISVDGSDYRYATVDGTNTLERLDGTTWTVVAPAPAAPGQLTAFAGTLFAVSYSGEGGAAVLTELEAGAFHALPAAPTPVSSVFVHGGRLFVTSRAGFSFTTDGATWTPVPNAPIDAWGPIEYDGNVYISGFAAPQDLAGPEWYRFDGTSFTVVASGISVTNPVVANGLVYSTSGGSSDSTILHTFDGTRFQALNATRDIWVDEGPVVLHGQVYVGADTGGAHEYLYRVDGSTFTRVSTSVVDFTRLQSIDDTLYYWASTGTGTYGWHTWQVRLTAGTLAILGAATVGTTVTAATSGWAAGATLSYQWEREFVDLPGETSSTYTITPADLGSNVSVVVTETSPGYASNERFVSTPIVTAGTQRTGSVALGGTVRVGWTAQASVSGWQPGAALTYQWYRGSQAISGATGSRYRLVPADVGAAVHVDVTGTLAAYHDRVVSSPAKTVLRGLFSTTPAPTIRGTMTRGHLLTASVPTWSVAATSFSYRWLRSGKPITGATHAVYRLVTADRGHVIVVKVTGHRAAYWSSTVNSVGRRAS